MPYDPCCQKSYCGHFLQQKHRSSSALADHHLFPERGIVNVISTERAVMLWSLTEQVYKMIGTSPVQDTISRGKANDNKSRYCMCLIFAEFKN